MTSYNYTTKADDTVDYIAWRHYGSQSSKVVSGILDANRGLAEFGPLLPPGVKITLPNMPSPKKEEGVRLWD
jgi:phage tail protein X